MSEDKLSQFNSDLQRKIAAIIIQSPSLNDIEVAKLVVKEDGSNPSRSYVARIRGVLGITPTEAEAQAPEITVEQDNLAPEEASKEGQQLPEEETLGAPEVFTPPEALNPPTSDDEILKPIFDRGFNRLLTDVILKRLVNIQEKIANDEEISDIETLALLDLKRMTGKQLTGDNLLIGTNIVAIAPLIIKTVDAYRKKKAEEKPTIPPPPPEPPKEEKTPETETPKVRSKNDPDNVPPFMRSGAI